MVIFIIGLVVVILFFAACYKFRPHADALKLVEEAKDEDFSEETDYPAADGDLNFSPDSAYGPYAKGHQLVEDFITGKISWKEFIDKTDHNLSRNDEIALIHGLEKGIAGTEELLEEYFVHRNGYFDNTAEVKMVSSFGEGCVAAKKPLITYMKHHGLKKEAKDELNKYLEQGVAGDLDVFEVYFELEHKDAQVQLILVKWFEASNDWAYSKLLTLAKEGALAFSTQIALVKLLEKNGKGVMEILMECSVISDEVQVEFVSCFEKGIPEADMLLDKCIHSYNSICKKAEMALAECFEKGVNGVYENLRCIHAHGYGYKMPHGFYRETEAVLVRCLEKGIKEAYELLLLQIRQPGLSENTQMSLLKCFEGCIEPALAYELLLTCDKEQGLCPAVKEKWVKLIPPED